MFQSIFFMVILIYASWYDIKNMIVPTHIHIMLFVAGLLNVSLQSFVGLIITFATFFITVLIIGGIGGGDVKLAGLCGFILKGINGLIGTCIGMFLALLIQPIINKIKKREKGKPFPLVPYLSAGYLLVYIIGGLI